MRKGYCYYGWLNNNKVKDRQRIDAGEINKTKNKKTRVHKRIIFNLCGYLIDLRNVTIDLEQSLRSIECGRKSIFFFFSLTIFVIIVAVVVADVLKAFHK